MTSSGHLTRLSRIALLTAGGDLVTKFAAKQYLANDPTFFSRWLQFAVVHNEAGAFGWSAGVYTWQLNLALTLSAIVFMVPVTRDLARVDRSAPLALGLIVGGALGNLASLVTSPAGVVDFILVRYNSADGIVLNVADVAAYTGLAMILRTGVLIATAIRRDLTVRQQARRTAVISVFAEKAAAELVLGDAPRPAPQLRPEQEVAVIDWNDLTRRPALAADAPERDDEQVTKVFDLGAARRRRAWLDDTVPRSLAERRAIEPDELR